MLLFIPLGLSACSGPASTTTASNAAGAVSAEMVASSWQVRMASDAARAPFEGRDSWVQYFQGKRGPALAGFVQEGDKVASARVHAEYAAIYRQAALTAANAMVQTYGADAQETDPKEMSYLLGVSGLFLKNTSWSGKLGQAKGTPVAEQDAAWKAWADGGAVWPPAAALAKVPGNPPAPTVGSMPNAGNQPSYHLPFQGGETGELSMSDPATLLALSLSHEEAARLADPASAASVSQLIDPWRLPFETPGTQRATLADPFLFMSFYASPGDSAFLADLSSVGSAAIASHQADSAYAVIAQHCTRESMMDVDCVLQEAGAFAKAIENKMKEIAGREDSIYRVFSDFARVGAIRAADRAAFALGDQDGMGRLRVNALDRSNGSSRDSLYVLSVAAWDAGNRNSLRCADLLHTLESDIPGLEAARFPVDALQIRVGRNAAPGLPMH